jgi:hypothetical protein
MVSLGLLLAATLAAAPPADPALLQYRNGAVLRAANVQVIFWGNEWADPAFAVDVIDGIDTLFAGYSGSNYAYAATEYSDKTGAITPNIAYLGHIIDMTQPPVGASGLTVSAGNAEVLKITANNPAPNTVYMIFTSTDQGTGKCGWHSSGSVGNGKNAKPYQFAYVPNVSGIAGTPCSNVQDTVTGHSLRLAAIANLAMHYFTRTITNPRGGGWTDSNGEEIASKCVTILPAEGSYPVFSNGIVWKLQGLWSNAAYRAGSGEPNLNGQPGCIW